MRVVAARTSYEAFIATIDGIIISRSSIQKVLMLDRWPYQKPVVALSHALPKNDLKGRYVRTSPLAPSEMMQKLVAGGWRPADW